MVVTKKNKILILILITFLIISSLLFVFCFKQYNYEKFNINKLEFKERPYYYEKETNQSEIGLVDSDGVPLFYYNGLKYYHPVKVAKHVLKLINNYNLTLDSNYLLRAEHVLKIIINKADSYDESLFFPYNFDFKLHGYKNCKMVAPWYSSMAQGQILSCLSRMYELSNNPLWLNYANKVFKSLSKIRYQDNEVWVTMIDDDGFLWLEEYPKKKPTHALNGKIFAIFGIYDYYMALDKSKANNKLKLKTLKLLWASLTTIKRKIYEFRNPGDSSSYCLLHRVKAFRYHKLHIEQLNYLYKITGDDYFNKVSLLFKNDKF